MSRTAWAAGFGLFVGMAAASAAPGDTEIVSKLASCRSTANDVQRLACFDAAFKAPSAAPATPGPQAGVPAGSSPGPAATPDTPRASGPPDLTIPDSQSTWLHRSGTSPLDNSPIEVALLPASHVAMSRMVPGMPQHAALVVRCQEGKTDLYVAFSDIVAGMSPPIRVSYRIGKGGEPRSGQWQISQDRQSYGFWHTPQTIPVLRELSAADEFFVRSDAGAMGTAEATFTLAGMTEALAPIRKTCGW